MTRIYLTTAILSPRLSDFLRHSIINFRLVLYLVTCFLRVTVSFQCRSQVRTMSSLFTIIRYCDKFELVSLIRNRNSNETVTLRKHVTKYKNMPKWMVEFFRKPESRGDKIARVNSIRITKSIILLPFFTVFGSVVIEGNFPSTVHLLLL